MHYGLGKSLRSIIKQYSSDAAESSTGKNYLSVTAYIIHILDDFKAVILGFCVFFNPLNAELNPICKSQLAKLFCGVI